MLTQADKIAEQIVRIRALISQGKAPEVLQAVDALLQSNPEAWAAPAGAVELYLEIERPAKAQELLETWLKVHPQQHEAWSLLGVVLSAQKRAEEAAKAFEKASQIAPAVRLYRNQRVSAFTILGRRAEVLQLLQQDVKDGVLSPMGHHLLAIFEADSRFSLDKIMEVGAPVRVVPMMGPPASTGVFFKARVEEVVGNRIRISYPTAAGVAYPWMGAGQQVLLACFKEDKYFGAECVALARAMGQIPTLELSQPQDMARIQRRQHLRLALELVKGIESKGRPVTGFRVVNLSLGGCLAEAPAWQPILRDRVTCRMEVDAAKCAPEGTVVRVDRPDAAGKPYRVAVRFDAFTPTDSERLAKKMHQHQLELRRKGLLSA